MDDNAVIQGDSAGKFRVASLFAGIGGICYGFRQAGAEVVWANELDRNACKTYRRNFGDEYLVEGDIRAVDASGVPDVDILNGGFPCQAFSVAGLRKGFADTRGTLFFEIARIIEAKRPRAVLLENVKNLVAHDGGRTFQVIRGRLEELGYHVSYKVLNTMEYGGVPQNRERIYVAGFRSEEAAGLFSFPDPVPLERTVADIVNPHDRKPASLYYDGTRYFPIMDRAMTRKDTVYQWRRTYVRENRRGVCPTLTANMGTGGHNVPLVRDDYGIRKLTPEECVAFQGFPAEFSFPDDIPNSSKYKQAGNSVSVPVVRRVAERMIQALSAAGGE